MENKKLKTFVDEFDTITGENIEINKVGKKKSKAYACNGNVMTRAQMIKFFLLIIIQLQSQAIRGM